MRRIQWEYLTETFLDSGPDGAGNELLNARGVDGWELIQALHPDPSLIVFIFKRPILKWNDGMQKFVIAECLTEAEL